MKGTLSISWGKWGGFYRYRSTRAHLTTIRVCAGWFAITYIGGLELDDLMEGYADEGDIRTGLRAEVHRLRASGMDSHELGRERAWTADRLAALLVRPPEARSLDDGWPGTPLREEKHPCQ